MGSVYAYLWAYTDAQVAHTTRTRTRTHTHTHTHSYFFSTDSNDAQMINMKFQPRFVILLLATASCSGKSKHWVMSPVRGLVQTFTRIIADVLGSIIKTQIEKQCYSGRVPCVVSWTSYWAETVTAHVLTPSVYDPLWWLPILFYLSSLHPYADSHPVPDFHSQPQPLVRTCTCTLV